MSMDHDEFTRDSRAADERVSTMNAPPDTTRADRQRLVPLVLVAVPLVYLAMSTLIDRPFVFPDEAGAITNARFVAGRGDRSPWWYLPGYGAFVAPVLVFTRDLGVVTLAFQVLNAVLGALSAVGLYVFGRQRFPTVDRRITASASVVVLLYPAFVYFGTLAIADNALITAGIWSVLAVDRIRHQPAGVEAAAIAFALGLVGCLHSRALVIVLAAALSLAGRTTRRLGAAVLALGVASSFASRLLIDGGADTVHAAGSRQSMLDLVAANASVRAVAVMPFTLLGQIINITTATVGLAALGLIVLITGAWNARSTWAPHHADGDRHVLVLVALTALLSASFTNQGQGDLAVYGRYLEVVLPIPLLVGLLALIDRPSPTWMRSAGPALLIVSACVLVAIRGYDAFGGRLQYLNVAGIGLAVRPFNRIDPILIALLGAVGMWLLGHLSARSPKAVLPAVVILFFASVTVPMERSMAYVDRVEEEAVLVELISDFRPDGATECVGLDQAMLIDPWAQENYQMLLLDVPFAAFDSTASGPPCPGLLVSSRPDLGSRLPGWSPVGWENNRAHWLWASPLVLAGVDPGLPIRPNPGTPLASMAASVDIVIGEPDPAERVVRGSATVTNDSASTFVPPSSLPDGMGAVRVGVEWRRIDDPDNRIHEPRRFDLIEPLRPGVSQTIDFALSRDLPGVSANDGPWILRVELVQEFVRWAEDSGAGAVSIELAE
jgi:hypothetical protein